MLDRTRPDGDTASLAAAHAAAVQRKDPGVVGGTPLRTGAAILPVGDNVTSSLSLDGKTITVVHNGPNTGYYHPDCNYIAYGVCNKCGRLHNTDTDAQAKALPNFLRGSFGVPAIHDPLFFDSNGDLHRVSEIDKCTVRPINGLDTWDGCDEWFRVEPPRINWVEYGGAGWAGAGAGALGEMGVGFAGDGLKHWGDVGSVGISGGVGGCGGSADVLGTAGPELWPTFHKDKRYGHADGGYIGPGMRVVGELVAQFELPLEEFNRFTVRAGNSVQEFLNPLYNPAPSHIGAMPTDGGVCPGCSLCEDPKGPSKKTEL